MSTIHTAMTGKTDSLIDEVRESEDRDVNFVKASVNGQLSMHEDVRFKESMNLMESELQRQREHPETMDTIHPDYMRMVVHQMD